MIASLLLFLLQGAALPNEAEVRAQAWLLHQTPPSAEALRAQWHRAADPAARALLAKSIARGLPAAPVLSEITLDLAQRVLAETASNPQPAAPGEGADQAAFGEGAEQAALRECLAVVTATPPLVDITRLLLARAWSEESCIDSLVRWQVLPESADDPLATALASALQRGWLPAPDQPDLFLGLLRGHAELRVRLLEAQLGTPLDPGLQSAVAELDFGDWTPFAQRALEAVQLDSDWSLPGAVRRLWRDLVLVDFAPGRAQLLQEVFLRHYPWLPPQEVDAIWPQADPAGQRRAMVLLSQMAPAWGYDHLLRYALDPQTAVETRAALIGALLRGGGPEAPQDLRHLLAPSSPRALLRALLNGLRWNLPADLEDDLVALLPRLRTEEAVIAVELLVRICSKETRLQWLSKLAPLPAAARRQILLTAWYSHQEEEQVALFEQLALSARPQDRELGRIGLQAAWDQERVAEFFAAQLELAEERAQVVQLEQLRELRSDAALDVLLRWLGSEAGWQHPQASSYASLLVEEESAEATFLRWWGLGDSLPLAQRDWAASNLAPTHASARAHLLARFPEVSSRTQGMFLSRMEAGSGPADYPFWLEVLRNPDLDDYVRRLAAHLLHRNLPHTGAECLEALQSLRQRSQDAGAAAETMVIWSVLLRGLAVHAHGEILQAAQELVDARPQEDAWQLRRTWMVGLLEREPQDQLHDALAEVRSALTDPQLGELDPLSRPQPQEQTAHAGASALWMQLLNRAEWSEAQDREFAAWLHAGGAAHHPDLLHLLHAALPPSAALTRAGAEDILRATEAPSSFRRPRELPSHPARPLHLQTRSADFFLEVRARFDRGELDALGAALAAARKRWPGDRRSHLWSGWAALAEQHWAEATLAFANARHLSGVQPYPTLEPRLGQHCVAALESGDLTSLQEFLEHEAQAAALLRGRTVNGLFAQLAALVKE